MTGGELGAFVFYAIMVVPPSPSLRSGVIVRAAGAAERLWSYLPKR